MRNQKIKGTLYLDQMLTFQLKNNLTKIEILPSIKKQCYFLYGSGISVLVRLLFN